MDIACTAKLETPCGAGAQANAERCRGVLFFDERVPVRVARPRVAATPARGDATSPKTPPADVRAFLETVLRQAGVQIDDYRVDALLRRVPACLRALGCRTVAEAGELLARQPRRLAEAVRALLIGVTSFFRDAAVFRCLQEQVLALWETNPRSRVLSVGCSDGSELYSVAMLLARLNLLSRCELLGADCRADALALAARGEYDSAQIASVPPDCRGEYFLVNRGKWRVAEPIRQAIAWERRSAFDIPAGPWDLILCRNLAIYFEAPAAHRLWESLATALVPRGALMTGKAECPHRALGLVRVAPCLFRKR